MYPTHQFKDKFVLFLKIFFPILIYQFANYSASFVDTTMTGQYNTMDLAGGCQPQRVYGILSLLF